MTDLDRLIRLEGFLREETTKAQGLKVVLWCDDEEGGRAEVGDEDDASSAGAVEED